MEDMINTDNNLQLLKGDLQTSLKEEFSKIFYENNLDNIANATDMGFIQVSGDDIQQPSDAKEVTQSFQDAENLISKLSPKQELLNNSVSRVDNLNTPSKFVNFKEEAMEPYRYGPDSIYYSPNTADIKSKEAYYNPSHLHFDPPNFKNSAEFKENQIFYGDCEDEPLSLMWTETTPFNKVKPYEDYPSPLNKSSKELFGLKYDGSACEEENTYFGFDDDFKIKQDHYSRLEEDLTKIFAKKDNSECFSPTHTVGFDSNFDTRATAVSEMKIMRSSTSELTTTFNRQPSTFDYFDEFEDPYLDLKGRSSRGLRVLSLRVKDVVSMKQQTSYKDVADYLTLEVSQKLKAASQGDARDEQNVKRRVYDALNVLIAADILKKDGKAVTCGENTDNIGIHKRKKLQIERDRMKKKTNDSAKRVKNKKKNLQEMLFKVLAIQNLITRNKATEEAEEAEEAEKMEEEEKDTQSQGEESEHEAQKEDEEIIPFPFIAVPFSQAPDSMNLHMDTPKTHVSIESRNPLNIMGDTDVLLKLKMHYVSKDLFHQVLPAGIEKFIPPVYMDGLK